MLQVRALVNVALMATTVAAFHFAIARLAGKDSYLYWFLALFAWRYLRFFINLVAFWFYSPSPRPLRPIYIPSRDVTAVIPTVDPLGPGFRETLTSCANNRPAKIVVVTAGDELLGKTKPIIDEYAKMYPEIQFVIDRTQVANKRAQVALGAQYIDTNIAVLLDDHVYWGPRFLETVLYPFQDPAVGFVGTNKRVRRRPGLGLRGRIWNMLGATYLCRHNFEIRATSTVDGGVFVISGRTQAIRTSILRRRGFLRGYTDERFLFGLFGPLNSDDDNYITRYVVRHGWKIKVQYTDDTVVETDLGVVEPLAEKFLGQCLRWARTTWRSNMCSLVTDRSVWARQPYCVYAVYLTSLTNFALLVDGGLLHLFSRSSACTSPLALAGLAGWILLTKTVKVWDYFRRNPQDIPLFPFYVLFAYFHSLIKLWTLLTFYQCAWTGRRLDEVKVEGPPSGRLFPEGLFDVVCINTPKGSDCHGNNLAMTPITGHHHHHHHHNNNNNNNSPDSADEHPHIIALRALRSRIAGLRARQARHAEVYQQALLAELPRLREALEGLQGGQGAVRDNDEAIRAALTQVVELAGETAQTMAAGRAAAGETDVTAAVGGLEAVVAEMEGWWR